MCSTPSGKNDTIDLLLIAVRPDLQGKGVNAIILSKVMQGCRKMGIRYAETGPMLEENEKVQTQWQNFPWSSISAAAAG